jgi:predicted flavoprotein YhiN
MMFLLPFAKRKRPWKVAGLLFTASLSTHNQRWIPPISSAALSSSSSSKYIKPRRIGVIGGGASGIFAAISAAEAAAAANTRGREEPSNIQVIVLEATSNTLQKVKISGGGRCNVLHDTSKPIPTILSGYPRGQRELNGLYHKRFTPTMAKEWFEHRGVELKVEKDGRMFPITDSSQTIMDALMMAATQAGVDIRLKQKVNHIEKTKNGFEIHYKDDSKETFDRVILATGSSPIGYGLAKSLGHDSLVTPIPSLFTLNCKHAVSPGGLLHGLSGVSVPYAAVSLKVTTVPATNDNPPFHMDEDMTTNATTTTTTTTTIKKPSTKQNKKSKGIVITQDGPLLITHHGISGPATLRLSAFGAREFRDMNYRGYVTINWDVSALGQKIADILDELWKFTTVMPKRKVVSACPIAGNSIPKRLWSALVVASGFQVDTEWGNTPKKLVRQLATNLVEFNLEFTGKGTFKDEFVTAGGVSLKEIDMKTMESKICPGLFLCGEVINVDGITGGYNFMNCWSTGHVAGEACSDF